jgi:hypothetical protein
MNWFYIRERKMFQPIGVLHRIFVFACVFLIPIVSFSEIVTISGNAPGYSNSEFSLFKYKS